MANNTNTWTDDKFKQSQSATDKDNYRKNLETQKPGAFSYDPYKESDAAKQANANYQQYLSQKPGQYQNAWQTQLDGTLDKILNREKFSYDLNGDALYQQYKDQYALQGQQAMMDTMGQAAALTGGYGNSYAQTVGQQTYQGYMQQLNDKIPELYQLALDQYNRQGDELYNQYGLFADMDNRDYGRYRDTVSDYNTELNRLSDEARYLGEQDYGRYMDSYNMAYGQHRDQVGDWQTELNRADSEYWNQYNADYGQHRDSVSDNQWNESFNYQKEQDSIANSQWDQSFNYQKEQDSIANSQWEQSFNHQKEQDSIANSQWDQSFNYQKEQDSIANSQWDQTFNYQKEQDSIANSQWNESFNYQKDRDSVSDSQWQKTFDEGVRQFNLNQSSKGSSDGGSTEDKKYKSLDVGSTAYNTILADIDGVETYEDLLAITKRYIALGYDPDEIDELTAGKAKKLKPQKMDSGKGNTSYGSSVRNGLYGTQNTIN